ncbi:tRNA (guanine(46)-N(7))-methyltransferase TrmB [Methylocella silvestris]|uniref:tRNA (guanine-N(7)-)-methyltransferase n=1 Tax=Methylocella silvestris TaxID=199596 RepID=A0A2J7TI29_METSI|nr:tRNA (guanine(46)-N(7))-methyltransferase TrmB [Methylocella silvestris]PNG26441.1 tRNA (guanosine(46)-N7)-methyltransferase TrmB [Methylocella silvestris]
MENSGTDCAAAPLSEADSEPGSADGHSGLYGRRRGKRLTQRHALLMQTVLPAVAVDPSKPIDPAMLFGAASASLWLEIGFGGGEHLAACAAQDPGAGFIGCEPFRNGVAKAAALIDEGRLQNVRIYEGDARAVIAALPPGALDGVYLLYPDPWPKRRQRKRRFLADAMLISLARVMRPGAQLRFATDIDDNSGWTLARILRSPHFIWSPASARDWRDPWAGWSSTRYEAKAVGEGRIPAYFTFTRTDAPPCAEPLDASSGSERMDSFDR